MELDLFLSFIVSCNHKLIYNTNTPGQSGHGSNGNKRVLHIPQSSSITGASPSDCLVSYPGHSLGSLTPMQRCSWCILQPHPTGPNPRSSHTKDLEKWYLMPTCLTFSLIR